MSRGDGHHQARRAPRHTPAGLAWRQFAADPWVSAALAALIGLASLLLTAVPRALEDVQGRQLAQDVGELSALQRDVTGVWGTTVGAPSPREQQGGQEGRQEVAGVDPWAPFLEGAEQIRVAQPEPLRSLLQPAQVHARLTRAIDAVPDLESGYYLATLTVTADPALTEHVALVEGSWPGALTGAGVPVPVLVLHEAAEELHWEVGDTIGAELRLAGTYRPVDPEDPRWQHVPNGTTMGVLADPNRGEAGVVTAYLDPRSRGSLGEPTSVRNELWFPVDAGEVSGRVDTRELRQQLTGMLAQRHVVVAQGDAALGVLEGDQVPSFRSELPGVLDRVLRQQRATSSLLAVVAAGPLGVATAVTALGARLVVHRRRPGLALTLARGASPVQLRRLVALEGLALGVPAALLGHAVARLLLPGPTRWWEWVVTGVVALVPAAALALSLDDASLREQRTDLTARSTSRWRWVAETAVLALAALATWRLLDRETRGDAATESGIDLLAAAAPVLLALAACVVTLRLYPLPLAALTRVLRGRRSLTPFLGAARSLRDPAGGLVPALAVVLGTTIALVSAVLLTTVTRGAEIAAWQANGAAVRVTGPPVPDDLVVALEQVDGVAAVARVRDVGTTQELLVGGGRTATRVLVADRSLREVMAAPTLATGPPEALFADDGPVPVVLGGDLATGVPDSEERDGQVSLASLREPVEVVGRLDTLPGVTTPGSWVLVDAERWAASGRPVPLARSALISVEEDADVDAVVAGVERVVRSGAVTTVDAELDDFTSAPVTTGLTRAFVGATVLTGLLTVLAIVVVQLMGAGARSRLLALLRTLGLAPGQTRTLTMWELAPLLVTSLVVGAALGLVVPWVFVRAVDLTGLTGGTVQPALSVDPLVVGAVLLGVVLTVLLAVTVSAWLAGRTNLAQALRVGEDR
ncbi:FtsX-like permease family protein [Ornithinimicrobium sp. LYQ121]|uniref:FtsX-like permease family protein n=1 Tax=Ornithinimicrobium sp. LYQ121 TaxID=3378801 RepID=UPI003853706C